MDDIYIWRYQDDGLPVECNFAYPTALDMNEWAEVATLPPNPKPYDILLQGETISPQAGIEQQLIDSLAKKSLDAKPADRAHILLQLWAIPTAEEKAQLAEQGIELLRYLPDRGWLASMPVLDVESVSSSQEIRWIGEWNVERKLQPALLDGDYGSWAYNPIDNLVALNVQFHQDVTLDEGRNLVRLQGGEVKNEVPTINTLVVWIAPEKLRDLAGLDEIEWIEQVSPGLSPVNDCVRPRVGVDTLKETPYSLDGTGINMLIYDAGEVADTHAAFNGRLIIGDSSGVDDHATHVAGTAAGDGTGSPGVRDLRGMAPAADVISYGFEYNRGQDYSFTITLEILRMTGQKLKTLWRRFRIGLIGNECSAQWI